MVKTLWIICAVLVVAFIVVVAAQVKDVSFKKVKGTKTALASISAEDKLTAPPVQNTGASKFNSYTKSAILIDEKSSKVLYEKNADASLPIASTTKMMTAMVVLENYPDRMKDVVTITREMINFEGSGLQMRIGEKITVESLLKGMLIVSANDAANSLAYHLEGRDQFINKMNEKAHFIGLSDTNYKDPAGLSDEGRSTAKDLSVLAAYALRNEKFAAIVKTPNAVITSVDGKFTHELKNSNRMIRSEESLYYPYAIGVKTGFTYDAGHCLVSSAVKDDHKIVAVILNTNEDTITASAKESRRLLDWGFNNWTWK